MTGYPGSKAASGVRERIIRQMPPHTTYIEPFAGYAAIFRLKRRAANSILIDASPVTCGHLRSYLAAVGEDGPPVTVVCDDALTFLPSLEPLLQDPATLIYFDPPYLMEVRTRLLYDVEFETPDNHGMLLDFILELGCSVMISHYRCAQYDEALKDWRRVDIPAMTRGGLRTESVWCNFPEPTILHDPRFAGRDYRERERIKRKRDRWKRTFLAMAPTERQAIAAALVDVDHSAVEAAMMAPN